MGARRACCGSPRRWREAEIRAPADGVILHRIAEPGLLLAAGQPALTMAFADRLYVRTYVPEPVLGKVRHGMAATVRVDAFPGKSFPAKVTEISPDAEFTPKPVETRGERVNLVYAAKVDLDRGGASRSCRASPPTSRSAWRSARAVITAHGLSKLRREDGAEESISRSRRARCSA